MTAPQPTARHDSVDHDTLASGLLTFDITAPVWPREDNHDHRLHGHPVYAKHDAADDDGDDDDDSDDDGDGEDDDEDDGDDTIPF
jgi:hypothetical protein